MGRLLQNDLKLNKAASYPTLLAAALVELRVLIFAGDFLIIAESAADLPPYATLRKMTSLRKIVVHAQAIPLSTFNTPINVYASGTWESPTSH